MIKDEEVIQHIVEKKQPGAQLTLLTDACRPGSIWDINEGLVCGIKLPPNILSIAASNNNPDSGITTIQTRLESGMFTELIVKALKNNSAVTPDALENNLKKSLLEYHQTFVVGTSSPELLTKPLFFNDLE